MITYRKANERGHAVHGWLDTWHTFSFSSYYDPAWMGFRSLRVINDDRIAPGHGFGTHGHNDMEILTYLISGELEHKDSLGNGRIIRPGEVQYMSAGSGVRHSEFNPSREHPCHLLQIWIEPDQKGGAPRYADRALGAVPSGQLQLIASKTGRDGSFAIHQNADLWLANLELGDTATHTLAGQRHAWIHVAEGEITLNGETLSSGDAAAVTDETFLRLHADKPSQVLLFDLN
jgi:redox-sensitive bicupin YhaK (pirin superfamily)